MSVQQVPPVDLHPDVLGDAVVQEIARYCSAARGFDPDAVINKDRKILGWMVYADYAFHMLNRIARDVPDVRARIKVRTAEATP
jgi:hypothetical protein